MKTSSGFTLIEMLVALVILSLTSLLALQALHFGSRLWTTEARQTRAMEELTRARDLLRQLIEQSYPQDPQADPAVRWAPMESDGRVLRLSAPAPLFAGQGGLARWWIDPEDSDGSRGLRVGWSFDRTAPSATDTRSEVLIAGIQQITWSFLIQDASGFGQWVERWRPEAPLPRLVRVEIQFPLGDARVWRPLVVAPRLSAPTECQFDVISRRCRGAT
jgi:general secretion pathway protein J